MPTSASSFRDMTVYLFIRGKEKRTKYLMICLINIIKLYTEFLQRAVFKSIYRYLIQNYLALCKILQRYTQILVLNIIIISTLFLNLNLISKLQSRHLKTDLKCLSMLMILSSFKFIVKYKRLFDKRRCWLIASKFTLF